LLSSFSIDRFSASHPISLTGLRLLRINVMLILLHLEPESANGQIWQQAEYDYTYFYEYHPDVTIYDTSAGCRMKVEDEEETVVVKRIK
jgi:hypothetical protein